MLELILLKVTVGMEWTLKFFREDDSVFLKGFDVELITIFKLFFVQVCCEVGDMKGLVVCFKCCVPSVAIFTVLECAGVLK